MTSQTICMGQESIHYELDEKIPAFESLFDLFSSTYPQHSKTEKIIKIIRNGFYTEPIGQINEIGVYQDTEYIKEQIRTYSLFDLLQVSEGNFSLAQELSKSNEALVCMQRGLGYLFACLRYIKRNVRANFDVSFISMNCINWGDFIPLSSESRIVGCNNMRFFVKTIINNCDYSLFAKDASFDDLKICVFKELDKIRRADFSAQLDKMVTLFSSLPDNCHIIDDHGSSIYLILIAYVLENLRKKYKISQIGQNPFDNYPRVKRPKPLTHMSEKTQKITKYLPFVNAPHPINVFGETSTDDELWGSYLIKSIMLHFFRKNHND